MKKSITILVISLTLIGTQALAHSGRTDSSGGHNCSQKSINKGLCSGYHYHYGQAVANKEHGHEGHEHMSEFKHNVGKDTLEHKGREIKKV